MTRRATIRTTADDPALVSRALEPDNTDEMATTVDDGTVRTRIERESTDGLRATVDDYVVNLDVALQIAQHDRPTDAGTASDTDTNNDNE